MPRILSLKMALPLKVLLLGLSVISFSLLTALGANLRFFLPGNPVPLTLQTFFVLLAGGLLGAGWGTASQLFYLILGLTGLPYFALSAGLFGPSGGYLLSFLPAAFLTGYLLALKAKPSFLFIFTVLAGVSLLIDLLGAWQLSWFLPKTFSAFSCGVIPFLPGDLLKTIIASVIIYQGKKYLPG